MKIICQHFWMAVLFNASSLSAKLCSLFFGKIKVSKLYIPPPYFIWRKRSEGS